MDSNYEFYVGQKFRVMKKDRYFDNVGLRIGDDIVITRVGSRIIGKKDRILVEINKQDVARFVLAWVLD